MNKNKILLFSTIVISLGAIAVVLIVRKQRKKDEEKLTSNVKQLFEQYGKIQY